MGVPVGRIGDIGVGTCSAHSGTKSVTVTIATGAATVFTNGVGTATLVSIGISSCGHVASVISTSATVLAENAGVHRVGDTGQLPGGTYTLSQGSPNVMAGD